MPVPSALPTAARAISSALPPFAKVCTAALPAAITAFATDGLPIASLMEPVTSPPKVFSPTDTTALAIAVPGSCPEAMATPALATAFDTAVAVAALVPAGSAEEMTGNMSSARNGAATITAMVCSPVSLLLYVPSY